MKAVAANLLETIDKALPLLNAIDDAKASQKPAPEKWSYKEIIGHLIDSAGNNQQKFIRTIQKDGVKFPPYEQDAWVSIQCYNEAAWAALVTLWGNLNRHLAHLVSNIPDEALPNQISIGDNEALSLDFIVRDYPEHLKHHLKQILPEADFLQNSFKMDY